MSTKNKKKNIKQKNENKDGKENDNIISVYNSSEDDMLELFKYNLDLVNTWIANMDTKVSISCGIFSIILAVIIFTAENYFKMFDIENVKNPDLLNIFFVLAILAALFFLTSIIIHFLAIFPNLFGKKNKKESVKFSIFYENISKYRTINDYIKDSKKATEKDFLEEIQREIYYNSFICSKKVLIFRIAIILGITSLAMTLLSIGVYYLSIIKGI